jgi:CRP/FNR family cyclic AMP-dependent transcriptional regulator
MARPPGERNSQRRGRTRIGGASALSGASTERIPADHDIFVQGEPCDVLFYLHAGTAKAHILSKAGQEAVIMILGPGEFFGEGAMLDNARRVATVTTMTECVLERIAVAETWRRLREDTAFAKTFMDFLLLRNRRWLVDLTDLHFHSTEKRLARTLLRLPRTDMKGLPKMAETRLSQETLADMIGTTRSRVSFFMNKFRRQGLIAYDRQGRIKVHETLLRNFLER